MKTIAQELELHTAIFEELCIEVPEKELEIGDGVEKTYHDKNEPSVYILLEQFETWVLNLTYCYKGADEVHKSDRLKIVRFRGGFSVIVGSYKCNPIVFYFTKNLKNELCDTILPKMYKDIQYVVEQEREESEKQANKDYNNFLDQMQREVS